MSAEIHKQAIVSSKAQLGADVSVGPFSIIEDDVEIGEGTRVGPHVMIQDGTRIGKNNLFYQFSNAGGPPADLKYNQEATRLEIGDDNTMREGCIIHRGTVQDSGITRIGSNNYLMPYAHVAHDCQIGNSNILGYISMLAGHVKIGNHVYLSASVKAVQHCRVGSHSYITPNTTIKQDIPAFVIVDGLPRSINRIGMQRANFSNERIALIEGAYKILYKRGMNLEQATTEIKKLDPSDDINLFIDSFTNHEGRGIMRPRDSKNN